MGGGPAGLSTALFLAHAAPWLTERIVVLEREHYPREKYCAGALGARADLALGRIGVQVQVPSVPVSGVAFQACGRRLDVRDGVIGRVVRRMEYDHELARQARARGIRIVEGAAVRGVRPGERGVTVELGGSELRARVLVGADGVASVVRRSLGFLPSRYRAQALEVDTEVLASDEAQDLLLFDSNHRELAGYYWDFPTLVEGRRMMCRGVYALSHDRERSTVQLQSVLERELERRGLQLAHYRKKRYAERGFEPHATFSQPRVLLVGEAAGIDPVTGEGIAQAVQYGAAAGAYLAEKLSLGDLGFSDWGRALRQHSIGRDLRVREWACALYYGPLRPHIERFLLDAPEFIRVGLRHFSGSPWGSGTLLRAGTRAALYTALLGLRGLPRE